MVWRNKHRNTVRKGLVIILLLLQSSWVFSQQDPTRNRAVVGRDLTLTIPTEQPYSSDLRALVENVPEEVTITYGPVIRAYRKEWITEGRKEVQSLAEVRLNIRASSPGIYKLEGLQLLREGFMQELDPIYFLAFQWDEIKNTYPLVIQWKNPPETIYQGQAVPLMLESLYTESILFAESIQFSHPAGTILDKSSLPGEIERISLDENHEVYRYPLESWIFTALSEGTVSLRGGEVQINGLKRPIPPLNFEVQPLPDQVQSTAAVGTFRRRIEMDVDKISLGEPLEFSLIIEGKGNLPSLRVLDPRLTGWEIISKREELDILPDNQWGYKGSRRIIYRLHSQESSQHSIEFSPFYYWNPFEKSVNRLESLYQTILVEKENRETSDYSLILIDPQSVIRNQDWFHLHNPRVFLFFIPMFILFFSAALFKRIRWGSLTLVLMLLFLSSSAPVNLNEISLLKQAEDAFVQENYEEARKIYLNLQPSIGFNSSYYYNLGLIQWRSGHTGESQWSMRMALTGKPGNPLFLETLYQMDQDQQLEEQFLGTLSLRQNIFLLIFLFTGFLFFLSLALHLYFNQTRTLLLLCVFLSLWIISSGSIAYLYLKDRNNQAVVLKENVHIRKIQGEFAREWITLEEGTSLEILASHNRYLFVRTGFGLKGWVLNSDISRLYYGEKE